MSEVISFPEKLNNISSSYDFLAIAQNKVLETPCNDIILDFKDCEFSHAIFTSFIGSLMYIGGSIGKKVTLRTKKDSKLDQYFKRSGLYNQIVNDKVSYINDNAIPFCIVNMNDESIIDYVENILELAPIYLTEECRQVFFKNIYEIFDNASDHSRAKYGVYSCGHWMPNKKQLTFSVYDTGIGIPSLVREKIDPNISSSNAVSWALKRGNSTKQLLAGIPRGLGLSDLVDFVCLNRGCLNVFTNDISVLYENNNYTYNNLRSSIIGTFIGITIRADYDHIYLTRK